MAGEIAELGYSLPDDVTKAVDRAESMVFEVAQRRVADTIAPVHDLLESSLNRLEQLYERGESITGLATGYNDLDELLSGLQPSSLVVVGARPSMGKCVAWDTPILDPPTGAVRTAAEVHRLGLGGHEVAVASLTADGSAGGGRSGGVRRRRHQAGVPRPHAIRSRGAHDDHASVPDRAAGGCRSAISAWA